MITPDFSLRKVKSSCLAIGFNQAIIKGFDPAVQLKSAPQDPKSDRQYICEVQQGDGPMLLSV